MVNIFGPEYEELIQNCKRETIVKLINYNIKCLDINQGIEKDSYYKWPEEYKDLSNLDLHNIEFKNIDFSGVNFSHSDLYNAYFIACNLAFANLSYANCDNCTFKAVPFVQTDFTGVRIHNIGVYHIPGIESDIKDSMICPETGSFIGYKVAYIDIPAFDNLRTFKNMGIIKLEIPEDAKRLSPYFGVEKCRCDKAKVLEITSVLDSSKHYDTAYSIFDKSFKYKVGETISVEDFDDNRSNECSTGIHFFMTKGDALDYLTE